MVLDTDGAAEHVTITTPSGGVLTREVGAITGEVELWLDGADLVRVRYAGALDEYTVVGCAEGRSLAEVADLLATDPGVDADGNPVASHL